MTQPHESADLLAATHGWYKTATFSPDGSVLVTLRLPGSERQAVVDLAENTGMELNISIWETQAADGVADLMGALGLDGQDP